jgi:peptide/nickel transport system permease protein
LTGAKPSAEPVQLEKHRGLYAQALREFMRNWGAVIGVIILIIILLSTIFASKLTPYDPLQRDTPARLSAPSWKHPMGTDALGRDVLSRVLYGGRISLRVGFLSIFTSAAVGIPLGLVAGYFGGVIDNALMRVMDVILAFPGLVLIIWLVAVLGSSMTMLVLAIAFFFVPTYARLMRSVALTLREIEYVLAARSIGASAFRILSTHILPNALAPAIVLTTLSISSAIITGASLSFLGLGVRPPTPEWGAMLADGRGYLRNAWWIAFFPGMTITLIVLVANIVGDGLRDALDPKITHRQ